MSTDTATIMHSLAPQNGAALYDRFFVFGDSITQMSYDQDLGFGFGAALANGKHTPNIRGYIHT
jgi:hypothetical protein